MAIATMQQPQDHMSSPLTSEISSSEQLTSDETASTETSDFPDGSASDSSSSDDSSTSDESTSSSDDETSEGESEISADPVKELDSDASPSQISPGDPPKTAPSEPIPVKSASSNDKETAIATVKSIEAATPSAVGDDKSVCAPPSDTPSSKESSASQTLSDDTAKKSHSQLPPELAGGWGEEPEPAPWEWQHMPFDYMGILEEQRRTVFWEFRETRDGKGEWVLPNYQDSTPPEGKHISHGISTVRGRGKFVDHGSRVPSQEIADGKFRGRGRGRGGLRSPTRNHKPLLTHKDGTFFSNSELIKVDLDPIDTSTCHARSIIDTPNDAFDTSGLISPNPDRPSLPIARPKDEVKKSSAWTKEGKREREMSLLILPRPERVTMPAAILPRPDKKIGLKVKKTTVENPPPQSEKVETAVDTSPPKVEQLDSSVASVDSSNVSVETLPPLTSSDSPSGSAAVDTKDLAIEPPTIGTKASADAAQLLLQLVDLLRKDEKALGALKSLIDGDGVPPKSSPETADTVIPSERTETRGSSGSNSAPPTPPVEAIPTTVEYQPPPLVIETKPPPVVDFTAEQLGKPIHAEIVVYPTRKSKDHSKSKDRTVHKHKSKHPKHSREFIAQITAGADVPPVPQGFTAVAAVDIVDEELSRDDLWYHVPETNDQHDDEVSPKGVYTLYDLKTNPHRYYRPARKLYEPPPFPVRGKLPVLIDARSGSTDAYDATFQKVDAKDDLGVTSKPKSDSSAATLEKPINLRSTDKLVVQGKKSESIANPTPITPPAKPAPVMFDFNPPSPRRITRRVVLHSKEVATQTSPPTSPPAATKPHQPPPASRPVAIHHERYYNNALRVDPKSGKTMKRAFNPALTPEELKNMGASWCGSDNVFMGTLKNVDTGDDLMIVSKAKPEQEDTKVDVDIPLVKESVPVVDSPVEIESPSPAIVDRPVVTAVDTTAALHESLIKAITQDDGTLYALLTALSKTSPVAVSPAPLSSVVSTEKKLKKEKKEKEKSSKEGKVRKSSKSKKMGAADAMEGDIFGDLLGDEIPKWGILNPTA